MQMTNEQELTFDRALVREIIARRRRLWTVTGLAVWGASLAACLFLVPKTGKVTASVAMQQASGPGAALSSLAGLGGGGAKNYQGVLGSYKFADAAARSAGIQALYHLPTEDAAAHMVEDAVSVNDKKDGLLYITVALPGPATLEHGAAARTRQVNAASVEVAQAYIRALQTYLATSNVDQDAALVREAQKQLKQARDGYEASVKDLTQYVHTHSMLMAAPSAGAGTKSGSGDDTASPGPVGELQTLYLDSGQLDAEIGAIQAARKGTAGLVGDMNRVTSLPSEDPLLGNARAQVRAAQTELDNLRISLSDDNPDVVAARGRLAIAQTQLQQEGKAIAEGHTSDSIRLKALEAKKAVIARQIAQAESGLKTGRDEMAGLEVLRSEVMLRLEVLKSTASQYAVLSVQRLAGDNLMDVVDVPRAPDRAAPGLFVQGAAALFVTLFVLGIWLGIDYRRLSKRESSAEQSRVEAAPLQEAA